MSIWIIKFITEDTAGFLDTTYALQLSQVTQIAIGVQTY